MRAIAILAAYNESRFIDACLSGFAAQGVETYLIDNDSTDATVELASAHLGNGLIAIERMPREGVYSWDPILRRKAEIAGELDADWFIHADPDEVRLGPEPGTTLARALEAAGEDGYTAVNFQEYTFVPTRESPDHDHPGFAETMRWYYPFLPAPQYRLNAWRSLGEPVDLVGSGGHRVSFGGLRPCPDDFEMRHYLFLSHPHAVEKYVRKAYDPAEVARGAHRLRASLHPADIRLPAEAEMRTVRGDGRLDPRSPAPRHLCFPGPPG